MKKIYDIIPKYAFLPIIVAFIIQVSIYFGTKLINVNFHHYNLALEIDSHIPLIPWTITIYILSYVFWILGYIIIGRTNETRFFKFITCDIICKIICGLFFIFLPTMTTRPDVSGLTGIFGFLVRYIYNSDTPVNLFPSMHCLISWLCFIGVRTSKEVKKSVKIYTLIGALAICASTLTTRQHVIVDFFVSIAIAEIVWYICNHSKFYLKYRQLFNKNPSK